MSKDKEPCQHLHVALMSRLVNNRRETWWECVEPGCGTVFAPTGEIKMHVTGLIITGFSL